MSSAYKVVLVFNLQPGTADEELRRSSADDSFPARLARQPGFISMELVKVNAERTLSIQTWKSERDWWAALEAAKAEPTQGTQRENILVSREFFGGPVVVTRP